MTDPTAYRAAKPWLDDGDLQLYHGDSLAVLRGLPSGIAQTCVTSPPYWGLRDYGTGTWRGGDEACDHVAPAKGGPHTASTLGPNRDGLGPDNAAWADSKRNHQYPTVCGKCGAERVDAQLGLEATPDAYIAKMVEVFREVRRVLRSDGTLWLNIGDSYANPAPSGSAGQWAPGGSTRYTKAAVDGQAIIGGTLAGSGLKQKDLCGIPWRLAFALQADGWYLRSDIIWAKPNPMPESVTDRPTKSHEYVFLFSKRPRYFYDADAVAERSPHAGSPAGYAGYSARAHAMGREPSGNEKPGMTAVNGATRNQRSVWTIATQPFPEAHFATYPEELVRRCILAGTSERGECEACGTPWRRETSTEYENPGNRTTNGGRSLANREFTAGFGQRLEKRSETIGWEPSCSCAASTRTQLVLDPFIGSGTTALVARKHGRRSIGIDLSADYLEIAARRTQQLSLLGGAA